MRGWLGLVVLGGPARGGVAQVLAPSDKQPVWVCLLRGRQCHGQAGAFGRGGIGPFAQGTPQQRVHHACRMRGTVCPGEFTLSFSAAWAGMRSMKSS